MPVSGHLTLPILPVLLFSILNSDFGHQLLLKFSRALTVDPEIIRIAGRWKSLAYETYIQAFEQVSSRHLSNLEITTPPGRGRGQACRSSGTPLMGERHALSCVRDKLTLAPPNL